MENKIYPTIKNSILLCLLFAGIQIGLGILTGVLRIILGLSDVSPVMGILTALTSIISFGIVLLVGFKKTKRKFNEVFKFNRVSAFLWAAIIVFMTGFVIVTSEMDNLLNYFLPPPELFRSTFNTLMAEQIFIISITIIGIIPALTEELFFRGLILDGLKNNYSKRTAILISSLLFGIVHLNPWQFVGGFIIGVVSAWICLKTNSILLSIYIHFFNNALYTITVRYRELITVKGFNSNFTTPVEFQPLWFDLTGLVILIIGAVMFIKGIKKEKTSGSQAAGLI
jgi:membrane protease YdiL (CAAX protease family)